MIFIWLTLVKGTSKDDSRNLLILVTKESVFTFNNKYYIQVDGVATWSPVGPILANIFFSYHEENWLNKCHTEFKPSFYRRFVDNIFVLLNHVILPSGFENICPLNSRT